MANHHQRALELLDEVDQARKELKDEYRNHGSSRPQLVAKLHQSINVCMKLASIHAQLAEVDAIVDAGQFLDRGAVL